MNDLDQSSIVVFCIATDGFDRLWRFCLDSHRRYCSAHDLEYDLTTERDAILNPYWQKLRRALDHLHSGRSVVLVDADLYIRSTTPDVRGLLQTDPTSDIFIALGHSGRPNAGFMLLRSGENSCAPSFLETCLSARDQEIPEEDRVGDTENGHVIHFLKRPEFAGRTTILDSAWNTTHPPVRPTDYNIHFTGPLIGGDHVLDETASFSARRSPFRRVSYQRSARIRQALNKRIVNSSVDRVLRAWARVARFEMPNRDRRSAQLLWELQARTGVLEHPTVAVSRALLRPGDTAIDGGAHVGYFARLFSREVKSAGRVIAIEAHPKNAATLRNNTRRMGVEVVESALASESGDLLLAVGNGHSNHSLAGRRQKGETISVDGVSLDELVPTPTHIRLLKLDVEGAELDALKGLETALSDGRVSYIILEINAKMWRSHGVRTSELLHFLDRFGMELRHIRDDYRLGPIGFIDRRGTENYLVARSGAWGDLTSAKR